jgi:hypothetical protein
MEKQMLAIYSLASNSAVIEVPGRRFPGSVIQGDALMILCNLAQSVHRRSVQTSDQELIADTSELLDSLLARLRHYEETLHQHGIDLPYPARTKE